jgi:secreted trypsin-like serine protease
MTIGAPGEPQNCEGDSGGPAFLVGADGTKRLVGIVSRSANDATDCVDGSVHTRVDAYADWIATTLHLIDEDFQHSKLKERG